MIVKFDRQGHTYTADLSQPIDISIPLIAGAETVNCFYAPAVSYSPVRMGDFVGSTAEGGPVNFMDVRLNPHGNGTHTECVGHIASERFVIRESLTRHHFFAKLISVYPTRLDDGDRVILKAQIAEALSSGEADALIIRTLPNDESKKHRHYSGTNPPYLHHEAVAYMVDCGIEHLLLDLPSVDRVEDGGKLLAHRAFWQYPDNIRSGSTISELIFVNNSVPDGVYLLNIQTASFDLDASPSKPVLFALTALTQ